MNTIVKQISKRKAFFSQKCFFKLLSKIQFGKLILTDQTGTYVFTGDHADTTHNVHLQVHDLRLYKRVLLNGSLAAGEMYIEGGWDVDDLTKLIEIIIKNTAIFSTIDSGMAKLSNLMLRMSQVFQNNNIKQIKKNILAHYDLGNDFFQHLLDPSMMYSCAIFEPNDITLAEASIQKLDRICQHLQLKPSDHLLEIGTGWGGLAMHAAKNYGCKVTTTTISDKQYAYVKRKIEIAGLQDKIELLNKDYRHLEGKFDKVVSVEMIEAIGYKNFDSYFRQCNALLKPNGLFFLQAILINDQAYPRAKTETDFIKKYIFPGGCLPSIGAISKSIARHTQLQLIHYRDIGLHYPATLLAWLNNLNESIDQIKQQGFSDAFIRTWRYYFSYCIAAFSQTHITAIHAVWRKRE